MTSERTRVRVGLRRALQIAMTVLALVVTSVVVGPAPTATAAPVDAWPSTSGGADSTSYNPGESVITATNGQRLREAWSIDVLTGMTVPPAISGGVAYHVQNPDNSFKRSTFVATSVRTGKTLWTSILPANAAVNAGVTVAGKLVLLPYASHGERGGVMALNLSTRKVVWQRSLPAPPEAWMDAASPGQLIVDGGRVFVAGAGYVVIALRLSDGAPLWSQPVRQFDSAWGLAAADGVLYTGWSGITAHDAATGRELWTAPGRGYPVVAGGRVFTFADTTLTAVSATGCGSPSCPALWRRTIDALDFNVNIGGVDRSSLFVTYTERDRSLGVIARLSAASGKALWSAHTGLYPGVVARGGSTVWLVVDGSSLVGYSATATGTGTKPLRVIDQPIDRQGGGQLAAVSGGSVLVESWPRYLTGYRIPGT